MKKLKTKKQSAKETQPAVPTTDLQPNTKTVWWKNKKILYAASAALLLLALGACVYFLTNSPSSQVSQTSQITGDSKNAAISAIPNKTIDKTGALKLAQASAGECTALLPSGWSAPTTNETSTTFDAFSPDKSMYAGYGHQAINTQLAPWAGTYDPPLNDPGLYSNDPASVALAYTKIIVANLGGEAAVSFTDDTNEALGDYQLRSVASATHEGVVFYHQEGFAGDGVNYTYSVPMYFAIANTAAWQTSGLSLARVTASISCDAQLVARSSGPDIGGAEEPSEDSKDENGDSAGYNPQLGTEYAHDEDTGENYIVDPSRDWSSSGPDGGGYYIPKSGGNDYSKLQPGRSD